MTGQTALLVAERSRPLYAEGGGARHGVGPAQQVSGPAVDSYTHTQKKNPLRASEEIEESCPMWLFQGVSTVFVCSVADCVSLLGGSMPLRCFIEAVCFGSERTSSGKVNSRPASFMQGNFKTCSVYFLSHKFN